MIQKADSGCDIDEDGINMGLQCGKSECSARSAKACAL